MPDLYHGRAAKQYAGLLAVLLEEHRRRRYEAGSKMTTPVQRPRTSVWETEWDGHSAAKQGRCPAPGKRALPDRPRTRHRNGPSRTKDENEDEDDKTRRCGFHVEPRRKTVMLQREFIMWLTLIFG